MKDTLILLIVGVLLFASGVFTASPTLTQFTKPRAMQAIENAYDNPGVTTQMRSDSIDVIIFMVLATDKEKEIAAKMARIIGKLRLEK